MITIESARGAFASRPRISNRYDKVLTRRLGNFSVSARGAFTGEILKQEFQQLLCRSILEVRP